MILHLHSDNSYTIMLDKVQSVTQIAPNHRYENFEKIIYRYAYSFDNSTWSEWFVNDSELVTHLSMNPTNFGNIYIKAEVTISKNHSLSYAYYKLISIDINGEPACVLTMQRTRKTDILQRTNTKNLYRPYRDTEQANKLNKILARGVSDIFAFDATYFRTEVDFEERLTTFKTFPLSNVKEYKTLPVLINNNELPDSRNEYSEYDYDFQDELEIHIVIDVWREIFGDKEPNANDYLFLPLTNRMYQINTIYDAKAFMHTATFYRAMLVKFENRADVIDLHDDNMLAEYTEYVDDFDKAKSEDEAKDALKTMLHEPTELDKNISSNSIVYNGLSVLDFLYNFSDTDNSTLAATYAVNQQKDEFALSFWFELPELSSNYNNNSTSPVRIMNMISAEDNDDKRLFRVYAKNLDSITAELEISPAQRISVNCIGQTLQPNTLYACLVNYAYNEIGTFVSISIIDTEFNIIAEIVDTSIQKLPKHIMNMHIHGGLNIGNIRLKKTFVNKNQILKELSDKLPEPSRYYVADNAVAELVVNSSKTDNGTNSIDCPNIVTQVTGTKTTTDEELNRILAILQDPNNRIEDVSTAERDLLILPDKSIVYNTDSNQYEQLINSSWKSLLIGKDDVTEFEGW